MDRNFSKSSSSTDTSGKKLSLIPEPKLAWIVILGFILITTGLCMAGSAAKVLNILFPSGCLVIGIFLYSRYSLLYCGFTWWVFFLTPLIRRIVDYRIGVYTDSSPVLLAPFLVVLACLPSLYQNFAKTNPRRLSFPFVVAFVGVFFGYIIGLIVNSPISATVKFLEWFCPVLFGFYLFTKWRDYPQYRQNMITIFVWAILVCGAYGVYQYQVAPDWDRFWLQAQFDKGSFFGNPEPMGMRVYSTMNSPEPFARFMSSGLVLLLAIPSRLKIPASVFGYLALLLTTVRTSWLGWFVGFVVLGASLKQNTQMRLIVVVILITTCVVPIVALSPFGSTISDRFATLSDVQNDGSAKERQAMYKKYLPTALTTFYGEGIGGRQYDSAIVTSLLNLGWIGVIPYYMVGLFPAVISLFQGEKIRGDVFTAAARAIVFSNCLQFVGGPAMLGLSGMILWGFMGISMAAKQYYQYQKFLDLKSSDY